MLGRPLVIWVLPLQGQEPVYGGHQRGVVIPAEPGAALVVVQAELALELLVVELDLPPQAGEAGEPLGLGVGGEVREPVIGRLILALGPFDDQPFLPSRGGSLLPLVRGTDAQKTEPRSHPLAVRSVAERHRLEVLGSESRDQLADLLGLAVRARTGLLPAGPRVARRGHLEDRLGCEHADLF